MMTIMRWAIFVAIISACLGFSQPARDYYKELYAAGGLDQILSDRVCFDDQPELDTFFIFTESRVIREVMMADGSFSKAPKGLQAELKKDLLLFRGYDKGVPLAPEDPFRPDNGSWVSNTFKLQKAASGRVRFTINWETLRYKRTVEVLNPDGTVNSVISRYGRCESIPPSVKQRGK
jgi:hypothetical protein